MTKQRGEEGYLASIGVQLKFVDSIDKAMEFKRWVGERKAGMMCYDTETTGLRPDFDRIRLAQFGDQQTGWAIPFERWGGVVMEILRDYEGPLGTHNLKYDARMTMHEEPTFKWPWHRSDDSMALAHLANPTRPKGLKPMSARLVDPQAIAGQKQLQQGMAKNNWDWATVPLDYPPYWIYSAMDPVLTSHNLAALDWARKEYQEIYDLELGVTRVVAKMEQYGVRVDVPYMEQKQQDLLTFIQDSRNWLSTNWKLHNPTPLGLVKWFTENGIKMLDKKTDKGYQSMDKEVLKSIDHPVAKAILNMRKAEKLLNPYVHAFLNKRDANDRLHANFWTMGTRTARMSITDPALQTLPKKDTTIRTGVIPSEGHTLISFDMDQVEARLMAHFAGSQTMIDAFGGEEDFFCVVASEIFRDKITSKKDPRRQTSKSGVYGKIYGGGAETLAHVAGVPQADMESFLSGFDRNFPEVSRLQWELQDLAKKRQKVDGESWIRTPTGRRMVADDDMEYTLTNYLIQTHAAEIMKKKVVQLDAMLPSEAHLMLLVHDEILLEAPTEMVPELMPAIQEVLDDFDGYKVPLTWGGDTSDKSWGALVD